MPGTSLILPRTLFVFVHQSDGQLWHDSEVKGTLRSTSATSGVDAGSTTVPFDAACRFDRRALGPAMTQILAPAAVERDAERWRRAVAPDAPSRLSCVFAYGSFAGCRQAQRLYGWDLGEVRPFRLASEGGSRLVRVNLGIMSLARTAYAREDLDDASREALWRSYWTGAAALDLELPGNEGRAVVSSGHQWEYLVDGRLDRAPQTTDNRLM